MIIDFLGVNEAVVKESLVLGAPMSPFFYLVRIVNHLMSMFIFREKHNQYYKRMRNRQ